MKGTQEIIETKRARRKSNFDILDGRDGGKYYKGGDPRRGGSHAIVTAQREFHLAITVPLDEIWARLGLTDTRKPYEEMGPAVEPLDMDIVTIIDRSGRPITYGRIIYNQDGSVRSSEERPI